MNKGNSFILIKNLGVKYWILKFKVVWCILPKKKKSAFSPALWQWSIQTTKMEVDEKDQPKIHVVIRR